MARGNKDIPGQLTLFDFCTETSNYVVQANDLIGGKQALKLTSAKLIRAAIMQVVREDAELRPYRVTITELSKLLGISKSDVYRDINSITDDIIANPVYVKVDTPQRTSWVKIPWVTRCEYHSDAGVVIKLNDELKPFLINLRQHYTQYTLDTILAMRSVYAVRIFELLISKMMTRYMPTKPIDIEISVQQLRECCACEDKYTSYSNFKARVLDVAVAEINRVTMYYVAFIHIKTGRSVTGIRFRIRSGLELE